MARHRQIQSGSRINHRSTTDNQNQNHNNTSNFSNHHHHNQSTASYCSSNNGTDCIKNNRMSHQRVSSAREQPFILDVKINDIVGNGISGILYKWVNYGKGWRPRWFVLQDGVLSYYKIHGPDKILVNQETEKGSKVIGEESMRRISRPKNGNSQNRRKPVGEIHLKVSSIRESRSDDKRFSIFTGTKRLHLRAETREDRLAWMEALQAVKDMFPRMSNSELMGPLDRVAVSTREAQAAASRRGSEGGVDTGHLAAEVFRKLFQYGCFDNIKNGKRNSDVWGSGDCLRADCSEKQIHVMRMSSPSAMKHSVSESDDG
ncbi:hypothetical protein NC653_015141 [Populus alba x Populus x berolinensis]|uniref:PH domain-containing protein n=1 Tax=Populus alba x Populus x berolinensis TaxID=444605 RepID=A0AAD6QYS9_9ROSI|nr:hypothetical protein NC653_015141 [Populus alba x Populus x berolinensis]